VPTPTMGRDGGRGVREQEPTGVTSGAAVSTGRSEIWRNIERSKERAQAAVEPISSDECLAAPSAAVDILPALLNWQAMLEPPGFEPEQQSSIPAPSLVRH
jgi:hypothetical protein